ncbi:MAG: hypothetical protein C0490_07560, partial [Marivirga sp.]|nr:hypothetical protein [Marivirga sp.]
KNDEVDLFELLLKGINLFRANFWLIAAFFLIGSAMGVTYFFSSPKIYENNLIISSGILTESYCKILFDNANKYIEEGNKSAIAKQFGVSESTAKKINSFSIETLVTTETAAKENERFLITVEVSDQEMLPELEKGIVNYLENNAFVKVRVEQNKLSISQTLSEIDAEIKDLEEFKVRIFNGDFFQSIKGNVMFDPTSVNSKILELKERKINLQNVLQLANSVQVIEGFTRFEKQTKPKLSMSIVAGSVVGLFCVGLLIAFKSIRKLVLMAEAAK